MVELLKSILFGLISGVIIAAAGYLKVYWKKPKEPFEPRKFTQTCIIGAIVGIAMGYFAIPYQEAYDFLASMGIITFIEYVKKAGYRFVTK